MPGIVYLHGFCSSAKSAKGVRLAERFAEIGVPVTVPELDRGDFRNTTLTQQLGLISHLTDEQRPDMLVGSSLGGYLAALHAARVPDCVPLVVLLAPAFDFANQLGQSLGAATQTWRTVGQHEFFHYRTGRDEALGWGFLEDARHYEPFPDVQTPTRILHGRHDESVPATLSERFARSRTNVDLELLDTDHQMLDKTGEIWSRVKRFHSEALAMRG
ncbi:MAG: alpha/beta fold hydrolase [Bryobacterales bacterium]|nr:alpha/beta fold hydrolase [Bryobacterales bacterium]MDE0265395.1 alpha/beta fold hydrolase [Bryobacterales bacterium]